MRYDHIIYLLTDHKPVYDPETGDYSDAETERTEKIADIAEASIKAKLELYGKTNISALTVQTLRCYVNKIDGIEIDGARYKIDNRMDLRSKTVFTVSEAKG